MTKKPKIIILLAATFILAVSVTLYANWDSLAVFNTQGIIAQKERNLMYFTMLLSLVVVIPVFFMTFYISWKYRAGNPKAKYNPDWDKSVVAETVWWSIPIILIVLLGVVTWRSSHELDPFKAVYADTKPITIQVVALDWKWLFIYPQQGIASVNYVQFPEKTPIKFEITSDAPMNSFWIPQLGGQIYAMSGMSTNLHLMADRTGTYRGGSANISGRGFSGMSFTARSTSGQDFNRWVELSKAGSRNLSPSEYLKLAKPSQNNPVRIYSDVDKHLYDTIVMKYMMPSTISTNEAHR